MDDFQQALLTSTTAIVAANVTGRHLPQADLSAMINETFRSLKTAIQQHGQYAPHEDKAEAPTGPIEGAVTARKSLASPDHIISMIDGKPYKTLRRHLATNGLTPDQYRERYGLKADYPMVAPSYSDSRRAMAVKIGLGRKPGQKPTAK